MPAPGRTRTRPAFPFCALLLPVLVAGLAVADPLDEARALYREGKIAEAAEAFHAVAIRLEPEDPGRAAAAHNNACVLWRNVGDLDRAEEDCRQALRLRSAAEPGEALGKAHNNLGLVLQRRAEYAAAKREFEKALELNTELGIPASQAINLSNSGVNAIQAGWYAAAIDLFTRMGELAERHADEGWADHQRKLARINLAVVHERLGAYREALRLYRAALDEGEDLPAGERATLLVNLGVVYRNLGDPVQAERSFALAEATYRETGDRPALMNVLLNRALVQHLNLERPDRAEALYREALEQSMELGEATQQLQCLDYLGRFLLDRNRVDDAETMFRRAAALAAKSGSSEARAASLEGLGRCEFSRGDVDAALRHALDGIDEIERVRGSLDSDRLKGAYGAGKRPAYALAVEALSRKNDETPAGDHARHALRIAHRAKARELLDRLGIEEAVVIDDRFKPLGADRAMLEYFIGGTRLFAWVAHGKAVSMHDLGPVEEILADAAGVQDSLAGSREPGKARLARLTERLLAPFPAEALTAGRWTVATDRGLDRLPFELLGDPVTDNAHLVTRVDLSYLPSGALLDASGHGRSARLAFGIGDPARRRDDGSSGYLARRFDLGPLDAAAEELALLEDWLDAAVEVRRGEAATENAFTQLYTEGARIVHVASHTVLDESSLRSSAILLTPGDDSDGLMHAAEIARMKGSSRLTVLAACRTAAVEGEGDAALSGLTGAFLISGSSAVVATLWDVGDAATRIFMEQFYHGLVSGKRPDAALSEAKRVLMADPAWDDPSIWAAYVLVGNPVPVRGNLAARVWWVAPILLLLVAIGWWRYGRTSKRVR